MAETVSPWSETTLPLTLRVVACELDTPSAIGLAGHIARNGAALKALVIREESGWKDHGACGDAGAAALVNALNQQTSRLNTLRLENVGIRPPYEAIGAVGRLVESVAGLGHVSLSGARFSVGAMTEFALGLSQSRVTNLCLMGCNLTCVTVTPLVASLKDNRVLRTLDLNHNRLRCKTAEALADVLRNNVTLGRLDLQGNLLASRGVYALLGLLAVNHSLHALDIRSTSGNFELECSYPSDPAVLRRLTGFPIEHHPRGNRTRTRVRRNNDVAEDDL